MKVWQAEAPSNIALIKYMGKSDSQNNVAANPSLSLTTKKLITKAVAEVDTHSAEDRWEPLVEKGFMSMNLSERGEERFLTRWKVLKEFFSIKENFVVRSSNNFPSDCGIASSASSFAALTQLAYAVAKDMGSSPRKDIDLHQLAILSQRASGSSCRSLFEPWAVWKSEGCYALSSAFDPIFHYVVIADPTAKVVSSSEAHRRVVTSELFSGRPERAERRFTSVVEALSLGGEQAWKTLYTLCWAELWDMHALFETSKPPFGYMQPSSLEVLIKSRNLWEQKGAGPLVTMDAGANVHLLWRSSDRDIANKFKLELETQHTVIVGNE